MHVSQFELIISLSEDTFVDIVKIATTIEGKSAL